MKVYTLLQASRKLLSTDPRDPHIHDETCDVNCTTPVRKPEHGFVSEYIDIILYAWNATQNMTPIDVKIWLHILAGFHFHSLTCALWLQLSSKDSEPTTRACISFKLGLNERDLRFACAVQYVKTN